jgi:hypothetical protein
LRKEAGDAVRGLDIIGGDGPVTDGRLAGDGVRICLKTLGVAVRWSSISQSLPVDVHRNGNRRRQGGRKGCSQSPRPIVLLDLRRSIG